MPRASIYLPDDLHELVESHRGAVNLSAICARALREELEAADALRAPGQLMKRLRGPSMQERALAARLGLRDAVICETPSDSSQLRSELGDAAANYLDRNLTDRALIGVAGGRQTWSVVRSIQPRRLRVTITAIGVAANDPHVLHAHPNTLVTLLSVLYAPHAEAHLVGSPVFRDLWESAAPGGDDSRYVVVASCSTFDRTSAFSQLLGDPACAQLASSGAVGDFAGVFMSDAGEPHLPSTPGADVSMLGPDQLKALARRSDARIILVAGGADKRPVIKAALEAGLYNVLVTDAHTALTI